MTIKNQISAINKYGWCYLHNKNRKSVLLHRFKKQEVCDTTLICCKDKIFNTFFELDKRCPYLSHLNGIIVQESFQKEMCNLCTRLSHLNSGSTIQLFSCWIFSSLITSAAKSDDQLIVVQRRNDADST